MPRGRVAWFDPKTGEGVVVAGGHEYPVRQSDVISGPLLTRVPVDFDVDRDGPVDRAARVRVARGGRVNRRQRRFGETTARSADAAGMSPLSRRRPGLGRRHPGHPKDVVAEWVSLLVAGDHPTAALLYAPDAEIVVDGRLVRGRPLIERELPALAPAPRSGVRVAGAGPDTVIAEWRDGSVRWIVTSDVGHGLIRRQTVARTVV